MRLYPHIDPLESFERAARRGPLSNLSVSLRCVLIQRVLDQLHHERHSSKDLIKALNQLSSSFTISPVFEEWLTKRRKIFTTLLLKRSHQDILDGYKYWSKLSPHEQKAILRKSIGLYQQAYIEGVVEKLPFMHMFIDGGKVRRGKKTVQLSGSFSGDLETGHATLRQYTEIGLLPIDPFDAFVTAHHEATHMLQHHFAVACYRGRLSPGSFLYQEGNYYLELNRRKAYIPSSYQDAYDRQPVEIMAEHEGYRITEIVRNLSM